MMENTPATPPPTQVPPSAPKKGLSTGAKIGIGCGAAVVLLAIIGVVIATVMFGMFGPMVKDFAKEAEKNPTRAAATMMVKASMGAMEMVAEDDANKRYTVKETKSGKRTTIYWNEKTNAPEVIEGDFSAIPVEAPDDTDSEPVPEPPAEP